MSNYHGTHEPLFVRQPTSSDLVPEKLASAISKMPDDPKRWPAHILSELLKEMPYLSQYDVDIVLDRAEPEAGAGFGYAQIRNKTLSRPQDNISTPGNIIRVPIIIHDRRLQKFHIFETGKQTYPLNEDRVRQAMLNPAIFDTDATKVPAAASLIDQLYPPYQQRQGFGRVTEPAAMGLNKISSAPFDQAAWEASVAQRHGKPVSHFRERWDAGHKVPIELAEVFDVEDQQRQAHSLVKKTADSEKKPSIGERLRIQRRVMADPSGARLGLSGLFQRKGHPDLVARREEGMPESPLLTALKGAVTGGLGGTALGAGVGGVDGAIAGGVYGTALGGIVGSSIGDIRRARHIEDVDNEWLAERGLTRGFWGPKIVDHAKAAPYRDAAQEKKAYVFGASHPRYDYLSSSAISQGDREKTLRAYGAQKSSEEPTKPWKALLGGGTAGAGIGALVGSSGGARGAAVGGLAGAGIGALTGAIAREVDKHEINTWKSTRGNPEAEQKLVHDRIRDAILDSAEEERAHRRRVELALLSAATQPRGETHHHHYSPTGGTTKAEKPARYRCAHCGTESSSSTGNCASCGAPMSRGTKVAGLWGLFKQATMSKCSGCGGEMKDGTCSTCPTAARS